VLWPCRMVCCSTKSMSPSWPSSATRPLQHSTSCSARYACSTLGAARQQCQPGVLRTLQHPLGAAALQHIWHCRARLLVTHQAAAKCSRALSAAVAQQSVVALGVKRSPSSGTLCNNLLARRGSGFRHRAPLCSWSCTQPALCRGCCWECQDLGTLILGRSPGATHQL
jgi:hypothetical protein